ncbi:MAG: excinuclease ABC subunit UvrC [Nitrospirales bacterium]
MPNQKQSATKESHFLNDKIRRLPPTPGVYLFKNSKGDILYIGKAAVLADRVRSYFQKGADLSPKVLVLVPLIQDLETIVTQSELEALLLESNLIKRHRPQFNVVLRDDKQYPYLRLPIKDRFPRLSIVRRVKKDKALYFGPYVPTGAMRDTIKIIRKVFPLATCTIDIDGTADRACLEFEIKRCMAPCTGHQSQEDYHRIVQHVRMFLEGRDHELVDALRQDMHAAADQEEFEEAARLRDRIINIERTLERQRITQIHAIDQDVLGIARSGSSADLQLLFVRGGLLIGRKDFYWNDATDVSNPELIRSTIEQFYNKDILPPKELLVPSDFPDKDLVKIWLSEKKGETVRILAPERGGKYHLLQLAEENAAVALEHHMHRQDKELEARKELQHLLHLDRLPNRIEGFDISNTMGTHSVASMVVWENGSMKKADYRRFKIKTVEGANDFASMEEVMTRRYGGTLATDEDKSLPLPEVVLIDGGAGQLGAALTAVKKLAIPSISLFGLAKAKGEKEERIFLPGQSAPIVLTPESPISHLLQTIRDEAHRFAIRYHRRLRSQSIVPIERQRSRQF